MFVRFLIIFPVDYPPSTDWIGGCSRTCQEETKDVRSRHCEKWKGAEWRQDRVKRGRPGRSLIRDLWLSDVHLPGSWRTIAKGGWYKGPVAILLCGYSICWHSPTSFFMSFRTEKKEAQTIANSVTHTTWKWNMQRDIQRRVHTGGRSCLRCSGVSRSLCWGAFPASARWFAFGAACRSWLSHMPNWGLVRIHCQRLRRRVSKTSTRWQLQMWTI